MTIVKVELNGAAEIDCSDEDVQDYLEYARLTESEFLNSKEALLDFVLTNIDEVDLELEVGDVFYEEE